MTAISNTATTRQFYTLDGQDLKKLYLAGLYWLEKHYQIVNQLNVFPVPDGDTGINMLLTMQSAYGEIAENDDLHVGNIARQFAKGAVNGSRGNSGVILSQIWRGFSVMLRDEAELTVQNFTMAFKEGVHYAYDAAPKPAREGTILTVSRAFAEKLTETIEETTEFNAALAAALEHAEDILQQTPEMLPVLKEAGVVDSGGQGLIFILQGFLRRVRGESLDTEVQSTAAAVPKRKPARIISEEDFGHPYDVQLLLYGQNLDEDKIRAAITAMGDSAIVTSDGEAQIKVHVHVYDPGQPISYAAKLGVVSDVVVENMYQQYLENLDEASPQSAFNRVAPEINLAPGDVAVIAIAPGEGLAQVFYEQGAAYVIGGGQTMNPSTQQLLEAIQAVPVDKVILLPNNRNIILAAEQAQHEALHKQVVIVPSGSVPQGISAMIAYANTRLHDDYRADLAHTKQMMTEYLQHVLSGEITNAVRSVELNGIRAETGQYIGLLDGELVVAARTIEPVLPALLNKIDPEQYELVTLYYGADITDTQAQALLQTLTEQFPVFEFEVIPGGQPHYHYLISVE